MKLICIPTVSMQENIYIYFDEENKDTVIIDPGGESEKIIKEIEDNNLNLLAVLLTHGHFDHISAITDLKEKFSFEIYAHEDEIPVLENSEINLSYLFCRKHITVKPDILLKDDEVFSVGSITLKNLHTPGHTPGSCCYYDEKEKLVFSGDTLFYQSIGRCDLMLSDPYKIVPAIKNKILTLDDDVNIYPGHGRKTDVLNEKLHNSFLKR